MQTPGPRQTQLRVQRLLQQGMSEIVHNLAVLGVLVDHARVAKLIQRTEQHVLGQLADECQRVMRRARSDCRREISKPPRFR